MASGSSMMNGDLSRSSGQSGTLEETLQQMNILIQENRDLKGQSVLNTPQQEERLLGAHSFVFSNCPSQKPCVRPT